MKSFRTLGGILFLILLTGLVYHPAMQADVILDDKRFYVDDPIMVKADGLFRIWFHPLENNDMWPYIPITRSTFWIERQLFGLNLSISHLINIVLHSVTAILLWLLLKPWVARSAWWVAVLFAVHPVYVQSVAWISERKNMVSGLFFVLALWGYLKFLDTSRSPGNPEKTNRRNASIGWYVLTFSLFGGALLSKTSTIMLPVVFLLCHWWMQKPWKRSDISALLPFFGLSGLAAYSRVWFEIHSFGANEVQFPFTVVERLIIAGHVPFFYIQKLAFPYPLVFNYPKWSIDTTTFSMFLPVLSIIGLLGIALWKYRTWGRPLFLGLGAYGVLLFPVLGFFNNSWFQYSFVTDHWVHLPSIPLLLLAVEGGHRAIGFLKVSVHIKNKIRIASFGAFALVWGGLTFQQTLIYQNHETLWKATLVHNPQSWLSHYNLGTIFLEQKKYQQALKHMDEAVELYPVLAQAYNNRGILYSHLGEYEKAIEDYSEILRRDPDDVPVYNNRGTAYFKLKQYEQALVDYDTAIQLQPHYPEAYNNRANVHAELEQYDQALQDYQQALQQNPQYAEAYNHRGTVYLTLQQYESALQDFRRAWELRPDYAEAYHNQAVTLGELQQFEAALKSYSQALRIDPGFVKAYRYRGVLYSRLQRYQAGIADFNKALQLDPESAQTHYYRGLNYMALQAYDLALQDYTAAIRLEPDSAPAYRNRGLLYWQHFQRPDLTCRDWQKACELGDCQNYQLAQQSGDCP